ncbi:WD repeat-containing protein 64 [Mixophyes fleayi]|uniref:WD repeat-containing protein 64 n=1 Tax=Mixophyes fleayi TaxID=3061075 RepID=UPI003F4DD96F
MEPSVDRPYQPFFRKNFKFSLAVFKSLVRTVIAENTEDKSKININIKQQGYINCKKFHDTIKTLFGQDVKTEDIDIFYNKIIKHPDAPIDWTEIFGYYKTDINNITSKTDPENKVFFLSKREKIENATGSGKKKRDTIQCIVKVPLLDAVLTVSQKGTISLFNSQMIRHSYLYATESSWFVGCDFLNQLNRAVAVTERSIVVWDLKCNGKNQDIYICIKPMEHCLLCVCTVISEDQTLKDDILIGDDAGFVTLFTIGSEDLKIPKSSSKKISQPIILDSRIFKQFRRKLHNGWVIKVKYFPELNCFASCSQDSNLSLVLDSVKRIEDSRPVRVFSVPKGVNTFAYIAKADMLATGGADKVIRLWHLDEVEKPMGKLYGHLYSIIEIAINERDQHLISLSSARAFRVWDIQTLALLQVFCDTEQGPGDRRYINSMIFDNKHLKLLTGSCVLDVWPLTRMFQATKQIPRSHDLPINALVYNQVFHQVLSICSGSVLKVWEMETGCQVYEIMDAHGPSIEVTAAAVDKNGFYFATGAYNGSLKIWNFANGYEINALPPKNGCKYEEQGFCQLSYLRTFDGQHIIFALDMSGKIKAIQGKDDRELHVTMEFCEDIGVWFRTLNSEKNRSLFPTADILVDLKRKGVSEQQTTSHGGTITCFDALNLEHYIILATGSTNGEINMYRLDSSGVKHIYSRNAETISCTELPSNLKTQCTNTLLFILPKTMETLSISSKTNLLQDDSRSKKDVETSDARSEKVSETEDNRDVGEPHGHTQDNSHSVTLNGQVVSPLVASAHGNGYLYLWNTKGDLISKVLPCTKHPSIPLTALCTGQCGKVIFAGNKEGYIILWKLQDYQREGSKALNQQLYWRAHTLKIISLFYEESKNVVVSASNDGSIRLWYASNGNYIGYFGQSRAYILTDPYDSFLPCDITELPVQPKLYQNIRLGKKNHEIPLIYDRDNFKSIINVDPEVKEQIPSELSLGVKYFRCLSSRKVKRRPKPLERQSSGVFTEMPIHNVQSIRFGIVPSYLLLSQESNHSIASTTSISSKASNPYLRTNSKITMTSGLRLPPI